MKCKQVIATMLLAAVTTLALTSCAKPAPVAVNQADKMKGELSVYYVDYADSADDNINDTYPFTRLIQDLQNNFPDLVIKPTTFGNQTDFMTQVSTEIASGKGPDLFMLDYSTPLNWHKLSSSGNFENLSPYIEKDVTFKAEEYYEQVIKGGQIDGKQYVLPFAFNCISLHAGENKLASNSIKLEADYDYENILTALDQSIELAKDDDEIVPLALTLESADILSCFMEAFGMPFVDYKTNSSALDKDSLLKLCDFLKKHYPYTASAYAAGYENAQKTQNAKRTIFTLSNKSYMGEIITQNVIKEQMNDKALFFSMPKYDNPKESTAQISYYSAINGSSKNKQVAYDVAKALMDLAGSEHLAYRIPVSRDRFNDWIDNFELGVAKIPFDGNSITYEFELEDAEKAKLIAENIQYVTLNDSAVMQIVNDGMMPYIEGTGTFDDCYDETVNKLNLYINE